MFSKSSLSFETAVKKKINLYNQKLLAESHENERTCSDGHSLASINSKGINVEAAIRENNQKLAEGKKLTAYYCEILSSLESVLAGRPITQEQHTKLLALDGLKNYSEMLNYPRIMSNVAFEIRK